MLTISNFWPAFTCKSLDHHSIFKKKLEKLKLNVFFLESFKSYNCGLNQHPKIWRDRCFQKSTGEIYLPEQKLLESQTCRNVKIVILTSFWKLSVDLMRK